MRLVSTFLFVIVCTAISAQDSLKAALIQDAITSIRINSTIYYSDSSFRFFQPFTDFAKKGVVNGNMDVRKPSPVSIAFTKAELRSIDEKLKQQKQREWPSAFLSNGVRFPSNSYDSLFKYLATEEYSRNPVRRYYYYIGEPVFLRNNSVAIFRIAEFVGNSAGYDFIFIYTKEENTWYRKLIYVPGAW